MTGIEKRFLNTHKISNVLRCGSNRIKVWSMHSERCTFISERMRIKFPSHKMRKMPEIPADVKLYMKYV